jgi:hypothetical protein
MMVDLSMLEQEIGSTVEKEVALPPPALTPGDVWDKLKEREQAVQKRIHRERWAIKENYDKTVLSINQDFARRMNDAVLELSAKQQATLRALADRTAKELKDLDLLIERMGR